MSEHCSDLVDIGRVKFALSSISHDFHRFTIIANIDLQSITYLLNPHRKRKITETCATEPPPESWLLAASCGEVNSRNKKGRTPLMCSWPHRWRSCANAYLAGRGVVFFLYSSVDAMELEKR